MISKVLLSWITPHKQHLFRNAVAFGIVFAIGGSSYADEQPNDSADQVESSRLEMKTERVVVFKDGYCLVVKQATATTGADGSVFTDEVPDAAALGSFWVVPQNGTIKTTVAGWVDTTDEATRQISCTTIVEVVKSNLGKACSFEIGNDKIEGTLLKLLANDDVKTEERLALDARMALQSSFAAEDSSAATPSATTTLSAVAGKYFLIRTVAGDKMISVSSVKNLTIENMNSSLEQTVTTKTKHKRLTMKFAEADTKIKLNVMYFRPDVRWIPTYRVNLTDDPVADVKEGQAANQKNAELMLQGEIINDAEDFVDVPIHVVVGVPNFRFRSEPSPMVLESAMRNVLTQAAPQARGNNLFFNNAISNAIYTQRSNEFRSNRAAGNDARGAVDFANELSGGGGNDLYVYELPPMDLKRGERAMVPILSTKVAYRDIYTWDIELTHSETFAATSADSTSPLVLSETKVWRQVELINNTDIPWTTGAAMIVDGMQPLAQELLTYTSPGGICRVPITVSIDLRGKATDAEVKRDLKALTWRGRHYARVVGEISAELANNKTYAVPVEVRLRFGGKATKASDDGKITLESYRAKDWREQQGDTINNSSSVAWETTVEPGECFKPVVNYEFFLRY